MQSFSRRLLPCTGNIANFREDSNKKYGWQLLAPPRLLLLSSSFTWSFCYAIWGINHFLGEDLALSQGYSWTSRATSNMPWVSGFSLHFRTLINPTPHRQGIWLSHQPPKGWCNWNDRGVSSLWEQLWPMENKRKETDTCCPAARVTLWMANVRRSISLGPSRQAAALSVVRDTKRITRLQTGWH